MISILILLRLTRFSLTRITRTSNILNYKNRNLPYQVKMLKADLLKILAFGKR